jgi:hypothetical protein
MKKEAIPVYTNQSMTTSSTSIGTDINQEFSWSIQVEWTGAPVGTFTIQVSNDIVPVAASTGNPVGPDPAANVVNWSTYTGSAVPVTGSAGNWMWISQLGPYRWVRLAYAATSGTGTMSAVLYGKG